MTPWIKGDLLDKVLSIEPDEWFVLTMPAYSGTQMLCKELLSKESYDKMKKVADEAIFLANYQMERIDIKGRLYQEFKTYKELPKDTEQSMFYTDTADQGDDFLCSVAVKKKGLFYYVTDVLYTKEPQEITEVKQVDMIIMNDLKDGIIESNNGGRGYARTIQRLLLAKEYRANIRWFHQGQNKKARIMTNASNVAAYMLFPEKWADLWPQFYYDLSTYQKEGKNKHDDAPDTLTGIIEKGEMAIEMHAAEIEVNL